MKRTLVTYRTKPEKADENQGLIDDVFRELHAKSPEGLRYIALRLEDGRFVHFAITEGTRASSPLQGVEAFKAFQEGIRDRCAEPPNPASATIVGNYRMIED